jgi:hypothetical protein
VGRATALLTAGASDRALRNRLALAVGLLAVLAAWDAFAHELPAFDDGVDVAVVALVLLPAAFLVVWLVAPLAAGRGLFILAAAAVALAVLLDLADADAAFNVTKIVAYALIGFCFVQAFEVLSWVVLVAFVVPWVDVVSVYRGPTKVVVEEEPGIFEWIAVAFALPGERAAARLGPPDVLFFALFLAAAMRFGLRVRATWLCMTAAVGATLVATYLFDLRGLPALPAVAVGFLAPNADLLWARARQSRARAD